MGRGPYEKSGMIRDTALPPLETVKETFEIIFPFEDVGVDRAKQRRITSNELEVEVRLLYLPYGDRDQDHFVWKISKHRVRLEPGS